MSLQSALTVAVSAASLLAAVLAGAVAGVALGERGSAPATEVLTLTAPEAEASTGPALRSGAGFTGFGGLPALPGEVVRTGTVAEVADGELIIEAGGSRTSIRFDTPARLFALAPLDGELRAGDLVVLRLVDGEVAALLRVPPDLEEGAGR